jgi:DNA polymerase-3 subunit gamma/tau
MSYVVLARRFRPQTFDEVVGQDHASATLRNAVEAGRLAHAYLFTGPRGVGKTSMARILAKALNCRKSKGPTASPCGKCESCTEIAEGRAMDVVEMDAASHTGVDDVRLLREGALYATARDRFKVYIIDEAHMMSRSAFNALLKVLEEPPEHVKFVFATTEPERLPDTIVSRCQRFDFRRISPADCLRRLEQIAKAEKLKVDPEALNLIVRRSRGGLRDAQGLLDQLVSFRGRKKIGADDVLQMVGAVSDGQIAKLFAAVAEGRPGDALTVLAECLDAGAELDEAASALADRLRGALLVSVSGRESALVSGEYAHIAAELEAEAGRSSTESILRMGSVLAEARRAMRSSPEPRTVLELALVRLCELPRLEDLREIIDRLDAAPAGGPSATGDNRSAGTPGAPVPSPRTPAPTRRAPHVPPAPPAPPTSAPRTRGAPEVSPFSAEERTSPPPAPAGGGKHLDPAAAWGAFRAAVKVAHAPTDMLLEFCRPAGIKGDSLVLRMNEGSFFQQEQLESSDKRPILEAATEAVFGRRLRVVFTATGKPRGSASSAAAPAPAGGADRRKPAAAATDDKGVRKLMDRFEGRVVRVRKEGK